MPTFEGLEDGSQWNSKAFMVYNLVLWWRTKEHINSFHPNTKFTFEIKENNTLPFLDVLVKKESHCFSTSLYRKKTFTGLYTDFASLAPYKCKINWLLCLFTVLFTFMPRTKLFIRKFLKLRTSSILKTIKTILSENCFPKSTVNRIIKSF